MTIPGFGRLTPSQIYMVELAGIPLWPRRDPMTATEATDDERIAAIRRGRAALVRMTRQDFGYDLAAWRQFLIANPNSGFTHPYGKRVTRQTIDAALADSERERLVAIIEGTRPADGGGAVKT